MSTLYWAPKQSDCHFNHTREGWDILIVYISTVWYHIEIKIKVYSEKSVGPV